MPSWVADLLQSDRLLTLAFTLFMLWLIGKGIYRFFPFFADLVDLVRTLVGNPKKGIPGIGERMEAQVVKLSELGDRLGEHGEMLGELGGQVKKIHHEVTPNHGGSIKDEIGRVETVVNSLTEKLAEHIDISKSKDAEQEDTARKVDRLAAKWADAE